MLADSPVNPRGSGPTGVSVILLGTAAGPLPQPGRQGCASAVVVGDRTYLVDAGYGTLGKLIQAGLSVSSLRAVFVTHLHSDHCCELFTLPLLSWGAGARGLAGSVDVYGPGSAGGVLGAPAVAADNPAPGTAELFDAAVRGWAYDLNVRASYGRRAPLTSHLNVHDVLPPASAGASYEHVAPPMQPFTVHEDDRVRVSATLVAHPPVYPSYAYRFETDEAVIVFSGDTAPCDNLVVLADHADLLVHEAMHIPYYASLGYSDQILNFFATSHTRPEDVGQTAQRAGVGAVALSHIGPGNPREVSDAEWSRRVSSTFGGRVTVGHDLTCIRLPASP